MFILGVDDVLVLVLWSEGQSRMISSQRGKSMYDRRWGLPLVHVSEARKMDGWHVVVGMTEVMPTDSGVPLRAHAEMIQGLPGEVLVLEHDIHGRGVACACGVEVGRDVAAVVSGLALGAAGAAIVVAVGEGTDTELGRLAAVAVGHREACPC